MPTTPRVEWDFSRMNHRRDEYCAALIDSSIEGVMQAKRSTWPFWLLCSVPLGTHPKYSINK